MDQSEVKEYVRSLGIEFSAVLLEDGGYKDQSVWKVHLRRGRAEFSTEYRMGAAHREAKSNPLVGLTSAFAKDGGCRILPGDVDRALAVARGAAWRRGVMTIHLAAVFKHCTQPKAPELADVLWSLSMDAECVRHGQTLEDFCSEFGYDSDSKTAERIYNACRDEWAALIRLGLDLDRLAEVYQEW